MLYSLTSKHAAEKCVYPFQIGDREDSNLYISMKLKAAAKVGWDSIIQSYLFGNGITLTHTLPLPDWN